MNAMPRLERALAELNADKTGPVEPMPKARHKTVQPNAVNFDTRPSLYQLTGVDLTQIHGIGPYLRCASSASAGTRPEQVADGQALHFLADRWRRDARSAVARCCRRTRARRQTA